MVITFVLTPRSHYNTIIEPRAHFLLSLLENLSIDFPSHMIVSMIDTYQDTAKRDKLIFPLVITRILTHLHFTIPSSPLFYSIGAIRKEYMRSDAQLAAKQARVEPTLAQQKEVAFILRGMLPMPLNPIHLLLHLTLLKQRHLFLPLWISFSTCRLILVVILTIFLMRCVK